MPASTVFPAISASRMWNALSVSRVSRPAAMSARMGGDRLMQKGDILGQRLFGGQPDGFMFDHAARMDDLERARTAIGERRLRGAGRGDDETARPSAHFDRTGDLQSDQRLTQHRTADAEFARQFALRRQAVAAVEFTSRDQQADLRGHFFVKTLVLDGLERQGRPASR